MILRPRRLAAALATGALSERDKFQYLLAWTLLGGFINQLVGTSSRWDQLRVLAVVPSLLITAVGLVACFQANRPGDNRAFLERYVRLSLLVGLVTYAVYYLLYYGMVLVGFGAGYSTTAQPNKSLKLMREPLSGRSCAVSREVV